MRLDVVDFQAVNENLCNLDIERRTECWKMQCRHFFIELFRQEVVIVLVGLKTARSHRERRGRRTDLLRLEVVDFKPSKPSELAISWDR